MVGFGDVHKHLKFKMNGILLVFLPLDVKMFNKSLVEKNVEAWVYIHRI